MTSAGGGNGGIESPEDIPWNGLRELILNLGDRGGDRWDTPAETTSLPTTVQLVA